MKKDQRPKNCASQKRQGFRIYIIFKTPILPLLNLSYDLSFLLVGAHSGCCQLTSPTSSANPYNSRASAELKSLKSLNHHPVLPVEVPKGFQKSGSFSVQMSTRT